MSNIAQFMALVADHKASYIDFRFTDMKGLWRHMSLSASALTADLLEDGIYFDGSSILGWCAIHESDMILVPDYDRVTIDHFADQPTIIVFCDVYDAVTRQPYGRDPRTIAKRAHAYLCSTGLADQAYFGPEVEFFIFDAIRYDTNSTQSFYEIASDEFPQSNGKLLEHGNQGHRPLAKGGYLSVSPLDSLGDFRAEITSLMGDFGLEIEKHHHEVAPSQHEIGIKYGNLLQVADSLQIYKYVVRNVAHLQGKTATFMPKPLLGDNGSGMHVHQSLWKGQAPLFAGQEYSGLSDTALYYIGGILKHAKSLNAFTNPTTNSYKRLVPGYEAPVTLAYSARNRSAACRIPIAQGEKGKRVEVRFPDPTANGYLALSAMLMAGLDGIQNRIHPGNPADYNLFEEKENATQFPTVCGSLREALESLEKNYDFLTAGGVFSEDFLKAYMQLKWDDVHAFEQAPHPLEFKLYYSL